MDEVYVDMRKENEWIRKYFHADFVSVSQLIGCIEDLDGEIELLKEKLEESAEENEPDAFDEWHDKKMMYEEV